MKYILIILSAPFFLAGFLWSFMKQGWEDGELMQKALMDFHKEIWKK